METEKQLGVGELFSLGEKNDAYAQFLFGKAIYIC